MGSTDQSKTSFKGVSLGSAKVTGNVSTIGATFDGDLGANSMQVGADLSMGSTDQSKTSFKGV